MLLRFLRYFLRQAGSLERLGPVEVEGDAGDHSFANPPDRRGRMVHEYAVALGSRLDTHEHHDRVASIDEVLDVEPVALPWRQPLTPHGVQAVRTPSYERPSCSHQFRAEAD